ncbi:hypothetical protein PVAP13_6NG187903, partial [Panicum virgatum]
MLCYNYHQSGHHRSQCPNPSFCYGCKQSGHISSKCPNAKANKGLKLCGFGMPGLLFYSLNIPKEKGPETVEFGKQLRAIVIVTEGRGTRFRISEELNYLVGSEVNWEVKRLSTNEFMIIVPSIQATVQETDRDPESFHMLQAVWVKAEGIPKIAKKEIHVMELAYLVGDPEEVSHHPHRASRWSQRTPRTGASAAALLELRKAKQNLPNAGKNSTNAYIAFHDYDNRLLDSTTRNCGIKLGLDTSDADRKISLLKAKELAQAAISKAADLLKQKVDNEAIP